MQRFCMFTGQVQQPQLTRFIQAIQSHIKYKQYIQHFSQSIQHRYRNTLLHGRGQRKIRVGQFSQRPQAAGWVWGRAPRSAVGENFLGSRWGRNSQNLRSREGFCKNLKGWRVVWGAALAKFLILMLFYMFFTSFFINIFNL